MQEHDDSLEREMFLNENIRNLKMINEKLSRLRFLKEVYESNVAGALGHEIGQKTYKYDVWKLLVKRGSSSKIYVKIKG